MRRMRKAAARGLTVSILILSGSVSAHVHQTPDGEVIAWYPHDCCGNGDCAPAAGVERVGAGVWLKREDGASVLIDAAQSRRPSPDRHWHVCLRFDHDAQAMVQCVFEPPADLSSLRP